MPAEAERTGGWRLRRAAATFLFLAFGMGLVFGVTAASAQEKPPPLPDRREAARLVWSTLIALDHANRTGNYTVLRDLAGPSFREANDPARLAQIFARFRQEDIGLDQVVLVVPVFQRGPERTEDGKARVSGFFPTRPESILFDLIFERAEGEWKLFGISVAPAEPPEVEPGQVPPPR